MKYKTIILSAIVSLCTISALPQAMNIGSESMPDSLGMPIDSLSSIPYPIVAAPDTIVKVYESVTDSLFAECYAPDTLMSTMPLPRKFFLPAVYTTYHSDNTFSTFEPEYSGNPALRWTEDAAALDNRISRIIQKMVITNPSSTPYNSALLPPSPEQWEVVVNPEENTIEIRDLAAVSKANETTIAPIEVKKKHWMRNFNGSLQFSEAYISPNWYQGGNNNLNTLLNLYYNVKLNQKYHPKLLFESTFQYKLGMNNAPDDSLRNYNISQDIFQINTLFGLKARDKWYYSVTGQFKTQLLNNYPTNSRTLKAAFLSPASLTIGLGITYNTTTPKYTFDASINPLSYNLDICRSDGVNETAYGIDEGKHTKSSYGSSVECKLTWKIAYNISVRSRLFAFTDYKVAHADWENTFIFEINRFLTTQLFLHLRYDSETPYSIDNGHWRKIQLKEILSLGFSYAFSTI